MLFNKCYQIKYSRKKWMINDDGNSRFFYQSVGTKKRETMIFNLKAKYEVWIIEASLIQQCFINEFSHKFTSSRNVDNSICHLNIARFVTINDNSSLVKPISDVKIQEIVFRMDPYKAPKPVGFRASCYQKYWHVIN